MHGPRGFRERLRALPRRCCSRRYSGHRCYRYFVCTIKQLNQRADATKSKRGSNRVLRHRLSRRRQSALIANASRSRWRVPCDKLRLDWFARRRRSGCRFAGSSRVRKAGCRLFLSLCSGPDCRVRSNFQHSFCQPLVLVASVVNVSGDAHVQLALHLHSGRMRSNRSKTMSEPV